MKTRIDRAQEPLKPRQFTLSLSDSDVREFFTFAHGSGTTPAEVLQGFICDLIDGSQTRGSDERMYARQYFDRCNYSFMAEKDFLTWCIAWDRIDDVIDLLQTADYAAEDLAYYEEHPDKADPELITDLKETQADAEQEIADLYREYTEETERSREPAQELQEGIKAIRAYWQELEAMTTAGQ